MKYIVKDSNNKLMSMTVVSSMPQLPPGFEVVGPESKVNPNAIDLAVAELKDGILVSSLAKAIDARMVSIRAERDAKLIENDKAFMIALKTDQSVESLKAEADSLRNVPQVAEEAMTEMNLEEINSYNPFGA